MMMMSKILVIILSSIGLVTILFVGLLVLSPVQIPPVEKVIKIGHGVICSKDRCIVHIEVKGE